MFAPARTDAASIGLGNDGTGSVAINQGQGVGWQADLVDPAAMFDGFWAEIEVAPGVFVLPPGYFNSGGLFDVNSIEPAPLVAFLSNSALSFVETTFSDIGSGPSRFVEPSLDAEIVSAPEPGSLLLLGSGLVLVARRLRRK